MSKRALVIVDFQNDFVDGSLAVPDAMATLPEIERMAREGDYELIVTTQDWHREGAKHFEAWPVHCVQMSEGAKLRGEIVQLVKAARPRGVWTQAILKGQTNDGYSGFDGVTWDGVRLEDALKLAAIEQVDVVGLALDYCVKATALDAQKLGFKTTVPLRATRAVNEDAAAIESLREAGVEVVP